MILAWVLQVYVQVWSIQGRNCNRKSVFHRKCVLVSTCLFQHHTQWSFYRSNQTSFMTIWIGMKDTSTVLLVYVPVWTIQGRNCNQKWTSTRIIVCVSTSLLQHHTQWSFSRSKQTSFTTIWIGMNDTIVWVCQAYVQVCSIQGRNCNRKSELLTGSAYSSNMSASTSHTMKLL